MIETMQKLKQKAHDTLRWSEQIFKTDMVYLAKGGFWVGVTQIVGSLSAFILSIAFAHLFPKEAYGVYRYVLAAAGIVGALSLSGLGTAITQSIARGYNAALREGFWICIRWSWGMVLAGAVVGLYYFSKGNEILGASFLIIAIATPFISSASLASSFLISKKEFRENSKWAAIRQIIPLFFIIGALLLSDSALLLVAVYFFSNLLATLIFYISELRRTNTEEKLPAEEKTAIVEYSKHLSILGIFNAVVEYIDRIIIFQFAGAVELAVYTFALAMPLQLKGLFKGIFFHLAFPKFAQNETSDIKKGLGSKIFWFTFCILCVVVAYIILAPYFFSLLFPQYMDAVPFSRVFSLSLLFYSSMLITTAMQAKKMIRELYYANIASTFFKLGSLGILAALYGVWGIVYARVAYEFFSLLLLAFFFWRSPSSRETIS